jgi:hypothetical protein
MRQWPRYKIAPIGSGLSVVDTWTDRSIMSTYGGSQRDRRESARREVSQAEYRARRRVARIRRALLASSNKLTRDLADHLARDLDVAGIGRWDHWFH